MDKIKIYVACHKPGKVYQDDIYTPIHVGRAISKWKIEMSSMLGDDTGDNISEKNQSYNEMTAQYWVWKNVPDIEYVGFCHYRRYFDMIITKDNIDSIFKNHDVVLLSYSNKESIERSYIRGIPFEDYAIFLMVLRKLHPEYEQDTIDYLWNNKKHKCNMLICKKALFDEYAEWIFGILSECEKYIRMSNYSRCKRVFAYLAETFMPVYFLHHHYRICGCKLKDFDFVNSNNKEIIKDVVKDLAYLLSKPFNKKPHTFEDIFDHAVIDGLINDGILPLKPIEK